jgi:hypothetical protein
MPMSIFYRVYVGKIGVTASLPLTGPDMNKFALPGHRALIKIKIAVIIIAINKPKEFGPTLSGSII